MNYPVDYCKQVVKELAMTKEELGYVAFEVNNKDPDMIAKYISGLSNAATLMNMPYAYIIWGVEDGTHKIVGTEFDYRKEKNPCALCAKMRRAVLANTCVENGINKLALGHHREDAIETLLMSLFYEGQFRTFHPKSRMSRTGITVIRPLVYLPESHVKHMTKILDLPVVKSPCPADGNTEREKMKNLLRDLRQIFPDVNDRFLHALQQDHYDLWQKED